MHQQVNRPSSPDHDMDEYTRTQPRTRQDVGGDLGALVLGTSSEANQPVLPWPSETVSERLYNEYNPSRGINHANIQAAAESSKRRIEQERAQRATLAFRKKHRDSLEVIYQHQPDKNPYASWR